MAGAEPGPGAPHPASRALLTRHRLRPAEALPWLLAILVYVFLPGYLAFGTQVLIMILFALSLDLVLGYAGVVTLGHAAFFGVGAYTAGLLSAWGWGEPLSGLALAAAAAALVGAASGWVVLRTHGLTLLMLTMATAILLHEAANEREDITGGFDGVTGMSVDPLLGFLSFDTTLLGYPLRFEGFAFDMWARVSYLYALVVLFLLFLLVRRLVHSPFGQTLRGIRENVTRMHAIGSPVHLRLVAAYTIAAAIAGVAGGLFAQSNAYVTLEVLSFERSGEVLIMLILGGTGRLYGAFAGAAVYMVLEDQLAKMNPELWQLGVGLVLVFAVLFARRGLLGALEDTAARARARWRRGGHEGA